MFCPQMQPTGRLKAHFPPFYSVGAVFSNDSWRGDVPSPPQTGGCGGSRTLGTPPKKLLFVFSTPHVTVDNLKGETRVNGEAIEKATEAAA